MLGRPNKTEKNFDLALKRLKNGENISSVISAFSKGDQAVLKPMLETAQGISSLPTRSVPAPTKRRLYLEHGPARFSSWILFVRKYNLAPLVMAVFVFTITGTAYGATYALPGEDLFVIKRTYEKVQVKLTSNPENKAALQVQIAAQRLEDAQKVISKTDNEESKAEALKELQKQTVVALNNIRDIASRTNNEKTPELVDQVVKITEDKNTLVAKETPDKAKQSQAATKVVLQDIKKILAATDEQTAARIATPDTVEQTGPIVSIKDNIVKVGVNNFEVDSETTRIVQVDGTILELQDLSVKDVVSIKADILENKNIAVTIMRTERAPQVQGTATETTETKPTPENIPIVAPQINQPVPQNTPVPEKPKDTFGGFILEPIVNEE